jgi:hypothetical protein
MTASLRARSSAGQGLMKTLMKNCSDPTAGLAFSSVNAAPTRLRQAIKPPSGYEGFLSRRQAAAALGFASEFKVRRLEQEGRLRPVRGVMGSAWYPRAQVQALRDELAAPPPAGGAAGIAPAFPARWSDAQLIAHLRTRARAGDGSAGSRARTPVDLVADTGISIARAERVYRFWLAHDAHAIAVEARGGPPPASRTRAAPVERRSDARMERDVLLQQMRAADPAVRAAAFDKLRALR